MAAVVAVPVAAYGNHMAKCQRKTNTVTDNQNTRLFIYGCDFFIGIPIDKAWGLGGRKIGVSTAKSGELYGD